MKSHPKKVPRLICKSPYIHGEPPDNANKDYMHRLVIDGLEPTFESVFNKKKNDDATVI